MKIFQENENLSLEKISAQHISDKGLLSKIYKEFLKLNSKKMNNPNKRWAKALNRYLTIKTCRWQINIRKDAQCHMS